MQPRLLKDSGGYSELGSFDCNLMVGRPAALATCDREVTPDALLEQLAGLGVRRALVSHVVAKEYHPSVGNAQLLEALAGQPELLPCWVVLPHHTREMPEPEALIAQMLASGVRAARIYPGISGGMGHRFSLLPHVAGPLLATLERHRIPLFVDYLLGRRDEIDWREVVDVCERHPGLPVVLIRPGGRSDRNLYPLMRGLPNLHIESSGYNANRGIEALAEYTGPERILYGSGYPYNTMPGALFRVAHSRMPLPWRQLVAGGNLERLLNGVTGPADLSRTGSRTLGKEGAE